MEYDIIILAYGTFYYKKGTGYLHRKDGPALEWADGSKEWWENGERHRKNGPAIERADGNKSWWKNNLYHREDGPAVEHNGKKQWWINGERLSPEKEAIMNAWLDNKNGI